MVSLLEYLNKNRNSSYDISIDDIHVGDSVLVKSKKWFKDNADYKGIIYFEDSENSFFPGMSKFCGKWCIVRAIHNRENPVEFGMIFEEDKFHYLFPLQCIEDVRYF